MGEKEENVMFSNTEWRKTIIQEKGWMTKKCECGHALPRYSNYTEYGEYKICQYCGKRYLLIRKMPRNLQGEYVISKKY